MILLVLNAGSSSLKFAAWRDQREILRGQIEQIGPRARLTIRGKHRTVSARTMDRALRYVHGMLDQQGVQPTLVAHRIVHGGPWYHQPLRLRSSVIERLRTLTSIAPLHLPANLALVKLAARHWPKASQWGVFDTGVYRDLPATAREYALPMAITKKYGIRKYGFHGISHAWAAVQASRILHRPLSAVNLITLHLGAGDSMTLWHRGRPVDTSMGFTPLEGLTMATRSGDLDPMIPLYLQTVAGFSVRRVTTILNHQSGLFGLTGLRDIRDVLDAAGHRVTGWPHRRWTAHQQRQAKLAIGIFRYDIQRYLSSYSGLTKRLHAIVFTGSVGQNPDVQRLILRGVNRSRRTRIVTIPTDEESAIAEAVRRVIH